MTFDVKKMDIEDLIDCHKNAGYVVPKNEMKYFKDCRYEGFKNWKHVYVVMMESEHDGSFYLTRFYLSLGEEGHVIAEPAGVPFFEDEDEGVVRDEFAMSSRSSNEG